MKVQAPTGFRDLALFLEILNDPKQYKKQVAELEGLRKQINEGVDKRMTLDKAESLRSEADRLNNQANNSVIAADEKANTLVSDAKGKAKDLQDKFDEKCKKIEATQNSLSKELSAKQKELTDKESGLRNLNAELTHREEKVSAREATVLQSEIELREKSKIMSNAAAQLG